LPSHRELRTLPWKPETNLKYLLAPNTAPIEGSVAPALDPLDRLNQQENTRQETPDGDYTVNNYPHAR
jgi:hypothetical protein